MKYYCSKYAISSGKILAFLHDEEAKSNGFIYARLSPQHLHAIYYLGKDVFLTEDEAIIKAKEMRDEKIVSLKKQVLKLEKMQFKVQP